MAKSKVFDIGGTVGSILKIVVLAIIGILVWVMLSGKFLKSKKEAQDEAEFEKKGAFRSLIDFFGGEGASESLFPTSSEKDQEQQQQRDNSQNEALDQAEKELAETERLIKERDELAKKMTDDTIGASNLTQEQIDKLREENKKLAEQIVKNKAEQAKREAEARKKGEAPPAKIPEQEVDRTDDAFKVFRFTNPVTSKTGKTVTDFVIADQSKITKAEQDRLKQVAAQQVKDLGFASSRTVVLQSGKTKQVPLKPLVALKTDTLKRLETDERLRKQIEAIQKRNLGLRKPNEPL